MTAFRQRVTEDRRLRLLRVLALEPEYTLNDAMLADALGDLGHRASRARVRSDLDWLAEMELVTVDRLAETVTVARITERGLDVGAGRAYVTGVRRPGPDD